MRASETASSSLFAARSGARRKRAPSARKAALRNFCRAPARVLRGRRRAPMIPALHAPRASPRSGPRACAIASGSRSSSPPARRWKRPGSSRRAPPRRIRAKKLVLDADRIEEIERTVKHDVIAFLTHVEELAGADARWLHRGMTSSDVLDTSFAILLRDATDVLLARLDKLLAALAKRAREHAKTPMIGRSHGIFAEPVTFGARARRAPRRDAARSRAPRARARGDRRRQDRRRGRHVRAPLAGDRGAGARGARPLAPRR